MITDKTLHVQMQELLSFYPCREYPSLNNAVKSIVIKGELYFFNDSIYSPADKDFKLIKVKGPTNITAIFTQYLLGTATGKVYDYNEEYIDKMYDDCNVYKLCDADGTKIIIDEEMKLYTAVSYNNVLSYAGSGFVNAVWYEGDMVILISEMGEIFTFNILSRLITVFPAQCKFKLIERQRSREVFAVSEDGDLYSLEIINEVELKWTKIKLSFKVKNVIGSIHLTLISDTGLLYITNSRNRHLVFTLVPLPFKIVDAVVNYDKVLVRSEEDAIYFLNGLLLHDNTWGAMAMTFTRSYTIERIDDGEHAFKFHLLRVKAKTLELAEKLSTMRRSFAATMGAESIVVAESSLDLVEEALMVAEKSLTLVEEMYGCRQ